MSNGWDFVDPVDIIPKLPKNFQELIASKKWQERKEALELLEKLATENIRLDPSGNYKELVGTLSKILAKDSNINVCAGAAKCLTQLSKGLRTNFSSVSTVTPVIFEKFKEKKSTLRDPLIEAIDAVYATTTIDVMCDDVAAAIGKPNPNVKVQTNQFLYRVFKTFDAQTAPKKSIKTLTPLIAKCTGESDAEVREAAYSALGAIMNAIGKSNALTMFGEVANDKTKMEQIEKFYAQVQTEIAEQRKIEAELGTGGGQNGEGSGGGGTSEEFIKLQNMNIKLIAEKADLKTKLDKALAEKNDLKTKWDKAVAEKNDLKNKLDKAVVEKTELQIKLDKSISDNKRASLSRPQPTISQRGSATPSSAAAPATKPISRRSLAPMSNGITRPATAATQSVSSTGGRSLANMPNTTSRPLSAAAAAGVPPSSTQSISTTGLRLPSRSNSRTSIPISAAVQKAVASGSRLPAPRQ